MFRRLASALGWTSNQAIPVVKDRKVNIRTGSEIYSNVAKVEDKPKSSIPQVVSNSHPDKKPFESAATPQVVSNSQSDQPDKKPSAITPRANVQALPNLKQSSEPSAFSWRKTPGPNRIIKCLSNEAKFDFRPLVLSSVELQNGRCVRVAVANRYYMDLACRFLEAQFETEMHFEQGMNASVDDMELHLFAACKRSLLCPYSLIAFEEDQVVGLLFCSFQEYKPRERIGPFALKKDYSEEIATGPYRRRNGNRVKAFQDILLNEFPNLVDSNASKIGMVEMLVTIPDYNDGQLERILLRESLEGASDCDTKFLGALCSTDLHRDACKETGFISRLEVPFAAFKDRHFYGPKKLNDPKRSTRMTLMIANISV